MSDELVDFELVKFRAVARGWEVIAPDGPDPIVVVQTTGSHGHGSVFIHPTRGVVGSCCQGFRGVPLLTAPRWTLERLFAEPPDGWRVLRENASRDVYPRGGFLAWGKDLGAARREVVVEVCVFAETVVGVPQVLPAEGPTELVRQAERHRAAAELSAILAEIRP